VNSETGTAHGRLPWPAPDELDEERRRLYDAIVGGPRAASMPTFPLTDPAGRLEGPYNAMLLSPSLGAALQELGAAIRYRAALPDRCREIAILTLARERGSEFESYAHARVAGQIGITADELAALHASTAVAELSATERLVERGVAALCHDRDLDDNLYGALLDALGREQLNELITLTGYYDLLALSLRVWRTPLPGGDASSDWPSEPHRGNGHRG
jgi:alkylhydroperoxidase family enzyme